MTRLFNRFLSLAALALLLSISSASVMAGSKVLYVTHEPGQYHKYTPQLKAFKEQIAQKAGWDVTVITGSYDEVIDALQVAENAEKMKAGESL